MMMGKALTVKNRRVLLIREACAVVAEKFAERGNAA